MNRKTHGFQTMPFSFTENSDSDSVYQSQTYIKVLSLLMGSLESKVMLNIVLGEDGVGKTTLINYLCNSFPAANKITADLQSTQQFFQQVLTSFDQKISHENDYDLLLQLSFYLSTKFKKQSRQSTLLVIDNADKMSLEALKGLELLLGLNTKNSQILQIILVGRPKLTNLLNHSSLSDLFKNTSLPFSLEPLTEEETKAYTNRKIKLVGGQSNKSFTKKTYSAIFDFSGGIPSAINLICDMYLLRSHELPEHERNSDLVLKIIKDQASEAKNKNKSTTPVLALISILSGIILTLYFVNKFFLTSEISPKTPQKKLQIDVSNQKTKVHQQITSHESVVKKEPVIHVSENNISTIESQLAIAELQMADFKFSFPKNDNAYETYQAVLKTSPNEKRALKGMERISSYYLEQATQQYLQGKEDKAQRLIAKGLKVSPNHIELIEFKAGAKAENVKKQGKIKALLKKASLQFYALQLTKPANKNAYNTYQEIIALEKNNSYAKKGIQKILIRLKSQAQQAILDQKHEVALENNEQVLMITSKEVKNSFYKKANIDAIKTKKVIVSSLMGFAEKQIKSNQLSQPVGHNAFETYNKVLEINPNHGGAIKGVENLKLLYQKYAIDALSTKNPDQALIITSEGLKIFPNNSILLALQSNAIHKQKTVKKSKNAISNKKAEQKDKNQELKSFGTF